MTNTTEAALRDDAEAKAVLTKMIEDRSSWAANNQRMLDLLQPEWERFEAREGHNVYVARIYADHTSSLRKDRKELAALEYARAALSQPSPASSTAGEAREAAAKVFDSLWGCTIPKDFGDRIRRGEVSELADAFASLSPSSGEPASVAVEAVDPWLVQQLEAWPTRVDERFTTNITYLMQEAAKAIRGLSKPTPVEAGLRERIAKLIADFTGFRQWDDMANDRGQLREFVKHGYDVNEPTKDDCLEAGTAVLKALREPTPAMVEAGQAVDCTITAGPVWQAMVDAALAGKE